MHPFSVFVIAMAFFAAMVLPVTVSADLSDMKVYSPIVEKGDLQFEFIGNAAHTPHWQIEVEF